MKKVIKKINELKEAWENLKNEMISKTGDFLSAEIEDLTEIRILLNMLSSDIDGHRKNVIDSILQNKIPKGEKVKTKFGTVVHEYVEYDTVDTKAVKEYLKENGLYENFKVIRTRENIKVLNGRKK